MLKPLQTSASELAWTALAAQQLARQITAKWPELESLSVCSQNLPGFGTAITAQLTQSNWSSLAILSILKHELSADDCLLLSQGNWAALKTL